MKDNYFEEYKKIGKNIKKIRKEKGISQVKLSELCDCSLSYISKIEAPKCSKSFSLDILFRIAEVLEVDVKELL